MKTIEQKARAYDAAIERAKELLEIGLKDTRDKRVVLSFFPELRESEGEKIRKALIHLVNSNKELSFGIDNYDGIKWSDILAWLEKQGKQKASYTTIVETGDGGINALVTKELPTNGCDDEHKPEHIVEGLARGEDYGIDGLWHAINILEKTFGDVSGYQSDDGILSHECAISAVKELYEQKTVEENKGNLGGISPKWSEEDESWFKEVELMALAFSNDEPYRKKFFDWLKSLKGRYTWKPSDEQIAALSDINLTGYISYPGQGQVLIELYNDLKKLKG